MSTTLHTASATHDVIALLIEDHKKVKKIFKAFEALQDANASNDKKAELVNQVCRELSVHAQIEEEIFYPAVRKAIGDNDLMDKALVEHAGAKALIAQLQSMRPTDELYAARMTVLGEEIDHHATEEEDEMFPKVKKAKIDTTALGAKMLQRKQALLAESETLTKSDNASDSAASVGVKKTAAKH